MLFTSVLLSLASVTVGRLQNICGSNDLQNVACYKGSELFHWPTDAIAYIRLPDGGDCTGFLVGSGNYLMTNNHCISTQEDAEGSKFYFNFQTKDCDTDRNNPGDNLEASPVYSGEDLIYTSKGRDATLLKLKTDKKLHEIHGSLALSKDRPSRGEEAYIIHHPNGKPKQISWKNCKIQDVWKITGNVRHKCDVEQGSSGAPIISKTRGTVVAINFWSHLFGCSTITPNSGKIMSYVVNEIKDKAGEAVYNDITTSHRLEEEKAGRELHGKKMAIRSHDGRYISANDINGIVTQTKNGTWEKFTFLYQSDGTYALKTYHGKYMSAEASGKSSSFSISRIISSPEKIDSRYTLSRAMVFNNAMPSDRSDGCNWTT